MERRTTDKHAESAGNRRGFLKRLWQILGIVALAELLWFIISLLRPSKEIHKSRPAETLRVIGSVEDFPAGSVTPDRVNRLYIVREEDGGFMALSLTCPHLGCSPSEKYTPGPQPSLPDDWPGGFLCACHGSTFDLAGRVFKNKPAPDNLEVPPHMYLADNKLLIGDDKKA